MPEPFRVTRTNTKRYVGQCEVPGCDFESNVIRFRVDCAVRMREHCRTVHDIAPQTLNRYLETAKRQQQREEPSMKSPSKGLPALEKFSEYVDHLCVFANVKVGTVKGQFGTSECEALVWVYRDGTWKQLGETPIFWQAVGRKLLEDIGPDSDDPGESLGAWLRKGGNPERAGDFWWLEAAQDKPDLDALKAWNKEFGESF